MGRKKSKPGHLHSLSQLLHNKEVLNSGQELDATRFDGRLSKVLNAPQNALGKKLRNTLRVIDSVHSIGTRPIPRIDIVPIRHARFLVELIYVYGTGEPLRLEIDETNREIEFTLLHEVGHFLDYAVIPGSNFGRRQWGHDPSFDRFRDVIQASLCISRLRSIEQRRPIAPRFQSQIRYFLDPSEIWARAYAQFIATRSEDPTLLGILDLRRSSVIPHPIQWADGDFAPISMAIDALFRELGWII